MKILPSLFPFRSLGIELPLLQTVTLSSMCLWRMEHGLQNESPPTPSEDYQAFGITNSRAVRPALFEARHAMKDALIDTILVSAEFANARAQQIAELLDDAKAHKIHLAQACREAIERGLVPERRMAEVLWVAESGSGRSEDEAAVPVDAPGT